MGYLDVCDAGIEGSKLLVWHLELRLVIGEDELGAFSALLREDDLSDAGLRRISACPVEPKIIGEEVQRCNRRGRSS